MSSDSYAPKIPIGEVINLSKQDVIEVEGVVLESLPNAMFKVELQNKHTILAHVSGKRHDADELHSHRAGRQGDRRDVAL